MGLFRYTEDSGSGRWVTTRARTKRREENGECGGVILNFPPAFLIPNASPDIFMYVLAFENRTSRTDVLARILECAGLSSSALGTA